MTGLGPTPISRLLLLPLFQVSHPVCPFPCSLQWPSFVRAVLCPLSLFLKSCPALFMPIILFPKSCPGLFSAHYLCSPRLVLRCSLPIILVPGLKLQWEPCHHASCWGLPLGHLLLNWWLAQLSDPLAVAVASVGAWGVEGGVGEHRLTTRHESKASWRPGKTGGECVPAYVALFYGAHLLAHCLCAGIRLPVKVAAPVQWSEGHPARQQVAPPPPSVPLSECPFEEWELPR